MDLRLAGARRRHSRPAWRLVGDNRVLDEEKRGGLPANARILRLGPHGPQASQGVCGSLLHLVDRLKTGREGRAGPARGRTTRQTRRESSRKRDCPHGRGSTARTGCAHGSCQLQKSVGSAGYEEATSSNLTKSGGLGAVAADLARGDRRGREAPKGERERKGVVSRCRAQSRGAHGIDEGPPEADPRRWKALRVAGRFASFHERRGAGGQGERRRSRPEASEVRTTSEQREENARRQHAPPRRSDLGHVKGQGPR